MDQTTAGRQGAPGFAKLVRILTVRGEAASYLCSAPALISYAVINFIDGYGQVRALGLSLALTIGLTFTAGIAVRRAVLAPYAEWLRPGKKSAAEAEAARGALLRLPFVEALSIFCRWCLVPISVFALAPAFGVEYGSSFRIFSLIVCALNGLLALPAVFLGAELAVAPCMNSPGIAEAKARPRVRLSLRARLPLSVCIMIDYFAAVTLLHMAFLSAGLIAMEGSILCLCVLIAGMIAMSVWIMILFNRNLGSTLHAINGTLEAMNRDAGDLSSRLQVIAQDDVGLLSENFNALMGFLGASIASVKTAAEAGRAIGGELASTAEESSAAATQMAASMEALAAGAEGLRSSASSQKSSLSAAGESLKAFLSKLDEQASAVEESSAAIHQMTANLASIESSTTEKRALVAALSSDGAEGDRAVEEITALVSELARSTETIEELVGVISGFSKSTSLLAMNAAIEAAHAGDAGRGFAVVADEIRKLAESTAENSKDITKSLRGMVEKIERGSALAESTKSSFKKILGGIAVVDGGMEETLAGLTESSAGSAQIVEAVSELSALTSGIREAGQEIGRRMDIIWEEANRVSNLAEESERGAQEIKGGLAEIAQASVELSELGIRNADSISHLDAEVARFRL
jgi:methyl-accepting chemotaxis protein